MSQLVIVGGRLRKIAGGLHRETGQLYDRGVIATVDLATGKVTQRLSWWDPEWADQDVSHVFKGVSWYGELLLIASQRKLLWVDPRTWEITRTWSHKSMNDVHHAAWLQDKLWVVSTGQDAVLEVLGDGQVAFRGVVEPKPMPTRDQRGLDLEPTRAHANHVFEWDGAIWVTRFQTGDAVSVNTPRRRHFHLSRHPVHDGEIVGDGVYFTGVEGRLLHHSRHGLYTVRLKGPDKGTEPLGWCRSVHVEGTEAWVGFTRIRHSRFREHIQWAAHELDGTRFETRRPTRIQRHDIRNGALLGKIEVEDAEVDAIFGITAL